MSCPIKFNSNTIELIAHTSCYCILDLLRVTCYKAQNYCDLYFNLKRFVTSKAKMMIKRECKTFFKSGMGG